MFCCPVLPETHKNLNNGTKGLRFTKTITFFSVFTFSLLSILKMLSFTNVSFNKIHYRLWFWSMSETIWSHEWVLFFFIPISSLAPNNGKPVSGLLFSWFTLFSLPGKQNAIAAVKRKKISHLFRNKYRVRFHKCRGRF